MVVWVVSHTNASASPQVAVWMMAQGEVAALVAAAVVVVVTQAQAPATATTQTLEHPVRVCARGGVG